MRGRAYRRIWRTIVRRTLDEQVLVKQLGDLLNQHWQYLSRAMSSPSAGTVRGRILLHMTRSFR